MSDQDELKSASAQSTFLVRIVAVEAGSQAMKGQVEHVWSGRVAEFDSSEALLAFLQRSVPARAKGAAPARGLVYPDDEES